MAIKKPIVLNNGEFEQLQAGDRVPSTEIISRTNNNANAISIAQPVYADGNGTVDLAKADAAGTKNVLGLVYDVSIAASASGYIQTEGVITANTAQWDAVTGLTGGLVAGDFYYLSAANAGKLVATPPSSNGEYIARVGQALSTTELEISIEPTIKL